MSISIGNRNDAYFKIIDSLPEKRKQIFKMYEENYPCSRQDISEKYLIPINEVSGRTTELSNSFYLVQNGSKENRWTGKKNTTYRPVKDMNERIDLINARFVFLRDKKDKIVNDFNLGVSEFTREIIKNEIKKINSQINLLTKILNQ